MLPRLLLAVAVAGALTACSADTSPSAPTGPVVAVAAPTAPVSSPAPPAPRLDAVPAAGTVTRLTGPFDDRFQLAGTTLRGGVLRTELAVTSDVSELIVLETQSDFYDAAGVLLGSVRDQHEDEHGAGEEHQGTEAVALEMTAPAAWSARVHSAVLSVPVLVNE